MTVLTPASIAIVTNVSNDLARRILNDFFSALVEISRKTTKEARIELKGCGVMHLYKNRELAFYS